VLDLKVLVLDAGAIGLVVVEEVEVTAGFVVVTGVGTGVFLGASM
jgi:hypothetical protein